MNTEIYRLTWDSQISKDILSWLRNRELDIKFSYLWIWAKRYYDYDKKFWWKDSKQIVNVSDWVKLLESSTKKANKKKIVIISFWCGDSLKEIEIIKNINNEEIFYIWVDFSEEMLNISRNNLNNTNIKSYLIRSDISDIDLKDHIDYITRDYDERYFSFLWNTFSNIQPTNITDLLSYYMKKWDKLFFDLSIKNDSIKSSIRIFNHYKNKTITDKLWRSTLLSAFEYIWFPTEKWKILIRTEENNKIGLFKIIFYFKALEDIIYKGKQDVLILKWETIDFSDIYFYEIDKIKYYIEKHNFKLLNENSKELRWQFLFEKE